jgi:GNAT superfamily N-acetyltransferase
MRPDSDCFKAPQRIVRGEYEISADRQRIDVGTVHAFLAQSYWAPGIPRSIVERSIANSLCFGVYHRAAQVGFARVVTDKATFAYLADVFILEPHRGKGLAKWLIEFVMAHEDLQGLRRFMLGTRDAHGLYERFGFAVLANPSRMMDILKADPYRQAPAPAGAGDAGK